ncbi:MAG: cyclophilin-like fold protein [Chloroflexi bacterium]|nr:cyclophilin-like fold protein [Chloroflexota bacterium]
MKKARVTAGKARAFAWFNSTKSARLIWESLPLNGIAHAWGREIYFEVPLAIPAENAREVVSLGDLAYWPEGNCLCVFFGPTPVSQGSEIRAASPVNLVGRIINDPRVFADTSEADILIERVAGGVESIAVGTDEHTPLVDVVVQHLRDRGFNCELYPPAPWPAIAEQIGGSVARGERDEAILFCCTGTGVALAANKMPGVRAALCHNATVADRARRWNHANVLAIGLDSTTPTVAKEIVDSWFSASFDEEEAANVAKVAEIELRGWR